MPAGLAGQALLRRALSIETGQVTERPRVREIDDDEGRRLVRLIRRASGPAVTWPASWDHGPLGWRP